MITVGKAYVILFVLLFPVPAFVGVLTAQEAIQTPSQKTKEAVDTLGKAPSAIGKSLEQLGTAAKEKLQKMIGGKAPAATKSQPDSFEMPPKAPETVKPAAVFSEGKRDPFRPTTMKPRTSSRPRESLSPLERFELGQLKFVAIIWDVQEPRAMVEDPTGLGYVVKVGTAIGGNDGKIKAIRRNEVVVEEFPIDFYGAKKSRDVRIKVSAE